MQDVLDAAKADLQTAKDGLVSVVALKEALASTIDETLYTAISVQIWKDAKAEAQLVLDDPNATADGIAAAVAAIAAAEDALVEIPEDSSSEDSSDSSDVTSEDSSDNSSDVSSDSSKEDSSSDNVIFLGCNGSIGTVFASIALAGAAVAVLLKKKED